MALDLTIGSASTLHAEPNLHGRPSGRFDMAWSPDLGGGAGRDYVYALADGGTMIEATDISGAATETPFAPVSVTIFASDPGTYFLEDDGIPGNNFSRIRFPNGTTVTFEHPTGSLIFDPSVTGVYLVVNLTDSLGAANFTAGVLGDPSSSPDSITMNQIRTAAAVTLVSNGAIVEGGSDAGADVIAGTLILSAVGGVGTAANALETQVGVIEAETVAGGIAIVNFGTVSIGGLSTAVDGLDVLSSGDLSFTSYGTITLNDDTGPETIHGGTSSGNVSLSAIGFDSDILSVIDQDSISATRGNILLTAGRDVAFGTIGSDFDNDVRANGSITVNAGRDFLIDGFSDMESDNFAQSTGGNVVINAGRNIHLRNVAGTDAGIAATGSAGADVILTTGAGGTVRLDAPTPTALSSNSGDVIINADRVVIAATSGINAPGATGRVLIGTATAGREINLGSATDAGFALELSDAELDRIFTQNLEIGNNNSGTLTVSAALTPGLAFRLTLRSGEDISVLASMTVTTSLTLRAGNNVFLNPSTINVPTFAAFADQVGDDDGSGGIINLNGTVAASSTLTGNTEADTLIGASIGETLFGLGGNDTLRGNGGADTLDGGTGADRMEGGLGDDFIFVDDAGDQAIELAGQGDDRVFAAASWTLNAGSHVETISTVNSASNVAIDLTGNALSQTIFGNDGANNLDGGGGGDILIGFGGDDRFFIRNAADRAYEEAGGGDDRVFASVSWTLNGGSHIETISTTNPAATGAIDLTGNELAQTIFGNDGANSLDGGGGGDILIGGGGNDFFFIRNAADLAYDEAGGGADRAFSSVSWTLNAGSHIEIMSTTNHAGTDAIDLKGNELTQTIFGNEGANRLDGGAGADVLEGRGGADVFAFTTSFGGDNIDVVTDFTFGTDKLGVGGISQAELAAGAFRFGATAQDADDRIMYDSNTGALFYDGDGNGAGAAIQFATIQAGLNLSANDFITI